MSSAPPELVLTRIVNAPRQRVWQVFTRPEHIQHWWGPNGFTNTIFEMDVRVGGMWRYVMHGPAGTDGSPGVDYNNWIRYTAVVEPALLAYDHGGDDEINPEFRATVTLEDFGAQTRVTLRLELQSAEQRQHLIDFGAVQGGEQTLAKLDAYVGTTPPDQCFTIERSLQAPLDRVWRAWSDPAQFGQWWGPKGCTLKVQKMDFVEGGEFHYAMTWPGAPDMWGKFVYGRIVPMQSIEWINSFSNEAGEITRAPFPGMEQWPLQVFNTLTLSERDGQTHLSLRGGPINALAVERTRFAGFFDSLRQGFGGTLDQLEAHLQAGGSLP